MMRFAHVAVNVTAIDRAVDFYTQVLGYEVVSTGTLSGPDVERIMRVPAGTVGRNAFLAGDGARTKIELIEWRGALDGGHAVEAAGCGILALVFITTLAEIAELPARIAASGGRCPTAPEAAAVGGLQVTALIAADPDGNRLEFIAT